MITVAEAINFVKTHTNPSLNMEKKTMVNALGYTLAEDVLSAINMPPFRQSAMDGYAIYSHNEKTYKIIGEVKAGDGHHPTLKKGEAVRIFTGAAVPNSANAVIIQENVMVNGDSLIYEKEVIDQNNIRPLGEQTKKGTVALKKHTKLNAAAVGFLTTLGATLVNVFIKPSIAILVTGSELVEAGNALSYGEIYESNSNMLQTALQSIGYNNVSVHRVKDSYNATKDKLETIINNNDLVLISGGISVGDYDFVGKALLELNVKQVFYKVKQKPGKPLFFGKLNSTTIFALPGNPASALNCFYIYVHLALERISGNTGFTHTISTKKSLTSFLKKGTRAQFLKALVVNDSVTILEGQSSAMIHTASLANAAVFLSEETMQVNKGQEVTVYSLPIQ